MRWRKPWLVSMSDLFHAGVSDEFIARVWAVMAVTPQHTYQILTKRHGRMRSLLDGDLYDLMVGVLSGYDDRGRFARPLGLTWPLLNVWIGGSAEDQHRADLRIPALLDTPAAVRFVSAEPLLGPIDMRQWFETPLVCGCGGEPGGSTFGCSSACMQRESSGLDWLIWGGESGAGARRMDLHWARSLTEQCRAAGVACFGKQLGSLWGRESGGGGKGGLPEQWPADLRVREFPAGAR